MTVYRQVKALEAAGAIGAELEVVPDRVAAATSRRTPLLMLSLGSGGGCDGQYPFAEDEDRELDAFLGALEEGR